MTENAATNTDAGATGTPPAGETTTTNPVVGGGQTSFGETTPPVGTPGSDAGDANFLNSLPEEFKNDPTFKPYKDLNGLLKSHKELSGKLGAKVLERPGEGATEDQIAAYRKAIGVPDSADAYEFDTANLPDSIDKESTGALLKMLGPVFHDIGIAPQDAVKFTEAYITKVQPEVEKLLGEKLGELEKGEGDTKAIDNDAFTDMVKELYGDKHQEVSDRVSKILGEKAHEKHKEIMANLSNEQLVSMIPVVEALESEKSEIQEKYNKLYKETHGEDAPLTQEGAGATGANVEEARAKAKEAFSKMQSLDQTSPEYQQAKEDYNKYSAVAYT